MMHSCKVAACQPPIIKPDKIGGVVHGTDIAPNGGTNPYKIEKYVMIPDKVGTIKNGRNIIGFKTIVKPNKIGSLILNKPGIKDNLPNVFI